MPINTIIDKLYINIVVDQVVKVVIMTSQTLGLNVIMLIANTVQQYIISYVYAYIVI